MYVVCHNASYGVVLRQTGRLLKTCLSSEIASFFVGGFFTFGFNSSSTEFIS